MEFPDRLKQERGRLGMTQDQLADACNVSKRAQANYESGERYPDARYLAAAATVGVDVLYLATGKRQGKEGHQVAAAEVLVSCIAKSLALRGDSFSAAWEEATRLMPEAIKTRSTVEKTGSSQVFSGHNWADFTEVDAVCFRSIQALLSQSPRLLNEDLMLAAIQAIEEAVSQHGGNISSEKKARAALMVYKRSLPGGVVDLEAVRDAILLAA